MKALILAAGEGSRLQPITNTIPKQLIPVANKPVIEYVIEDIKDAGIDDIGIIIDSTGSNKISSYFGDGSQYNVDLNYIVQNEPKGLAHAVNCGREFVGEEPFVVYFGDTLISKGVTDRLVKGFQQGETVASIGLQKVVEPSRYGIAEFNGNNLTGMVEKPNSPPSNLAYIGTVVLSNKAFSIIDNQSPSNRGEYELTDTLDELLTLDEPVHWERINQMWRDVGTPEDVISTNELMLDKRKLDTHGTIAPTANVSGPVQLGLNSTIEADATVKGPVSIGPNTTIGSAATIGPYTSVGADSSLVSGTIENSVLMDNVHVECDVQLSESLIGPNTKIQNRGGGEFDRVVTGYNTILCL